MHPREIWNTYSREHERQHLWGKVRSSGKHEDASICSVAAMAKVLLLSLQHMIWVLGSGGSDVSAGKVLLCGWCFFWLLISDCVVFKLSSLVLLEILYQLCLNDLGGFCFLQLRKPGLSWFPSDQVADRIAIQSVHIFLPFVVLLDSQKRLQRTMRWFWWTSQATWTLFFKYPHWTNLKSWEFPHKFYP